MDCFVFLGGSCNPTTWRQVRAIPYLEDHGVSYFNPQVDDWNEAFAVKENLAKENCKVMFFVIENQTRGTMSLAEICYLIGRGKTLVISMDFECHPCSEINQAREFVFKLAKKENFSKVSIYKENIENVISMGLSTIYRKSKHEWSAFKPSSLSSSNITKDFKNTSEISSDKEELTELCKICFYIGQCKRAGVSSGLQKVQLLNPDSLLLQEKSLDYIKDMNRPRQFINSLL